MTDNKKDGPAKGSERSSTEGGSAAAGNLGAGGQKRPFATIDIKPSEIREVKVESPAPPPAGDQAATAAKIVAAQKALHGADASAAIVGEPAPAGVEPGRTAPSSVPPAGEPATAARKGEPATTASMRTPAAPTPAGSASGRFFTHLAAGLLGGALALLGGQQLAPMLGLDAARPSSSAVGGLAPEQAARLAVLEKQVRERLATLEAAKPPAPDPNAGRIEEMARQLAALGEQNGKLASDAQALREDLAKQASLAGAGDRLVKLEEQLAAMAAAAAADPGRAGRLPQLAQLTGQVADLKAAIDTRLAAHRKDLLAEIDARSAASTEAAEAARAGTQRLDREVTAVKSDATRLAQRVDQLKSAADRLEQSARTAEADVAGVKTALEAAKGDLGTQIKAAAKPADVAMAVAPVAAKVQALEGSVQGVLRAEDDRKSNAERIVLSLELGNLKRAMERGQAYASELAEVRKVAGNRVNLAALERFQNDGVPTIAELSRTFRSVSNAIIDADQQQPEASVVDRLMASARTVVRVKKTSYAPDDASAEAIASRMETALKELRLGDVMAEAKKLPAKAAVPAQDWLRRLDARRTIETSLAEIDAQLKSSLGAGPAAPTPSQTPAQKGTK